MPSCNPPSISVRDYFRAPPRRRKKRTAKAKPAGVYWTCEQPSGHTCGVHHTSLTAAHNHTRKLDSQARRAGRKPNWHPEKKRA